MELKKVEYESKTKAEEDCGDDIHTYYMDWYDDEPTDTTASIPVEQLILQNSHDSDNVNDDLKGEEGEYSVQPTDDLILVGHVDKNVYMLEHPKMIDQTCSACVTFSYQVILLQ